MRRYNVSRMPVLGNSTTEVLGIIDVIDALSPRPAVGGGGEGILNPFKITDYVHPPMTLIGPPSSAPYEARSSNGAQASWLTG